MDLNQEIRAQLDQNEAAKMLARVGLSLQNCSTERDLQLLVADYSAKANDWENLCKLLRVSRNSSEIFLIEDAILEKENLLLAQEILDRAPLAVIPKIMSHLVELAQCTIAPYEKLIHDFIKCNKRHLSETDLAQSKIMDYVEKQPEKKTEENLITLLSKTPIFDPENIIIFDICSFIKTESDAIKALQNEDTSSIDIVNSKEKTMMKNTTMKMSVNPQESMDKFLQRLEKSVMDFLTSGNKTKVLETIQKHQPDAVFASSEYYKIMIESILASLDDKSSMAARKTRMTIAVDKLIELEIDIETINHSVLSCCLDTKLEKEVAQKVTNRINKCKDKKRAMKLIEFATQYFPKSSEYHHTYLSIADISTWELELQKYRIKDVVISNYSDVCLHMLNNLTVPMDLVTRFCSAFNLARTDILSGFLEYHLLGKAMSNRRSSSSSLVARDAAPSMLSKMAKSSSWSQIHKRLAEIIKILSSHQSLVIDILKSTFSVIDKKDYEKIEFIFDQLKVMARENGNNEIIGSDLTEFATLNRDLQAFKCYRRYGYDSHDHEARIPFMPNDRSQILEIIEAEAHPENFFKLLPVTSTTIVNMPKHELQLKCVTKLCQSEINEKRLDDLSKIFKIEASEDPLRDTEIRMALRCYVYVCNYIKSPQLKRRWCLMGREEIGKYYQTANEARRAEILQLLGLEKMLNLEQKLDHYGVYSDNVRGFIKQRINSKEDITVEWLGDLFEVIYIEFFVPPYEKQVTKALEEVCRVTEQCLASVHQCLISKWMQARPIQTHALHSVLAVADPKKSTETLFTFAQTTGNPTIVAEALGIFLGYFYEEEIKVATKQLTGEALDRKVIFNTYKFAKFQEKMSQIEFQVTKKEFNSLQKAPEKFLQKILERCEPAEETFLILFDICHEYKVKSEPIWTLLFERIREPGALMKKMCLLNTASWFHDLCATSRLLLSNYHMAWNKALVNNLETKWEETILALYQFKRPIRLDIPRLFNLAIQAGYDLTACQIMVKAKLCDRKWMCEKLIQHTSAASLLSKLKENNILGGDMVIQYLLWMLKPSDFGQMDPGLILWLTKKMMDFKFIGIYIEFLLRSRDFEELRKLVIRYGEIDQELLQYVASLRTVDENEKSSRIRSFCREKFKLPGHMIMEA